MSVPTSAVNVLIDKAVTLTAAMDVVMKKAFNVGLMAYNGTLVETESVPVRVAVVRVQMGEQKLTEDNWNVSVPVVHANTAVETSNATVVIVPQVPVIARLLEVCLKKSCVPEVSVPIPIAVSVFVATVGETAKLALFEEIAAVFTGHATVRVEPKPVMTAGTAMLKETTWPARRVPTVAEIMLLEMTAETPVENVDTRKLLSEV